MVGLARLTNLRQCVETVLDENVAGDLIETGVWRGGACILMKAILASRNMQDRIVWLADSFEGLPVSTAEQDAGYDLSENAYLAVSLEQVRSAFALFGLLDERVRFIKGWFKDSLPKCAIEKLAILRLDGDLYESTMDVLQSLYDRVAKGGFIIIDDYNSWPPCKEAVDDYRASRGVKDPIQMIDAQGVFWRRCS